MNFQVLTHNYGYYRVLFDAVNSVDSMLPSSIRRVYRTSLSGSRGNRSMSRTMYNLQCHNQCQGKKWIARHAQI